MCFFNQTKLLGDVKPLGEIAPVGHLLKNTIHMAWPSVVESLLISSVIIINMMMVATLGSEAIAAVGLTAQPRLMALAIFISMSIALSAIVARRRGQRDKQGANKAHIQTLIIAVGFTVIISALCVVFADNIMRFSGSASDTHEMATTYFKITMAGIGFNTITLINNAAHRGAGNTKISMKTNMVANIVNILFNYLLIGGHWGFPALGIRGAAIATVIGGGTGFVMSMISVLFRTEFISIVGISKMRFDRETLRVLTNITSGTFAEQLFMRIGFMSYAIIVAKLGTTIFATYQIGMQVLILSFALGDGLSIATVALVGRSLGEERRDLAKMYGGITQRLGILCSLLIAVLCITLGKKFFGLFSQEAKIVQYAQMTMLYLSVITFTQISMIIYSGCLRGAGDVKYIAMVSLICITFLRPLAGWLLCFVFDFGLHGAWMGIVIEQTVRLILVALRFRSGKWMYHRI